MAQYIEIKAANPGCLLFYRMGDFYELFFEDAEIASRTLGIVLTKRGKHGGEDIPMCGVPVIRAEEYLHRLIAAGHRVAVCEQLEDPAEARKRGSKAVVKRDVVRLITPGTLFEETLLEPTEANTLLAVARAPASEGGHDYGLALAELSTGRFEVTTADAARVAGEIARLAPSEIVLPEAIAEDEALAPAIVRAGAAVSRVADPGGAETAAEALRGFFGLHALDGLGPLGRAEIAAAAALVRYVRRTQREAAVPLSPPLRAGAGEGLAIDPATRASLELVRATGGGRAGSLLATIDRTRSPAGARLLAERLASPLATLGPILERQAAVACFVEDEPRREAMRAALRRTPDFSRALTRLLMGRGGPRDLLQIRHAVARGREAAALLADMGGVLPLPGELDTARAALDALPAALEDAIAAAIVDDPPLQRRDGGFVRAGYDADLDAARALRDESRAVIAGLQQDYAAATGVKALKVRHNNFLGFFVEVPAAAAGPMLAAPLNARFIHRQTMQDAMRFSTPELAELEGRIASAGETATAAEIAAFDRILADLATAAPALRAAADALARIDVAAALAEVAARRGWTRPALSEGLAFRIAGGRHPVVEAALEAAGKPFVANDLDLSGADGSGAGRAGAEAGRILLVTGPNMGGKSTFLRQNALIAILAQIGSYVPAASAEIGLVDRVFSRVGASDDLASGRSTFMVEMVETAAILNQATARSLVILDEIGRGTATFDGLSIAWATIEHLHESVRARTLFATHYHELTALAGALPRLSNATLRATEHDGRIVFLHEVIEGAADRSYGIQVARLAGLPAAVTERARAILETLERAERTPGAARILDDLPLFAARAPAAAPAAPPDPMASLRAAIEAMRPDEMSPRAALDALYALRALLPGRAGGPRDRG